MTTLFLSYRRAENADFTGRIVDRLIPRFGRKQIFLDIDNIPPGVDFRTHITQWLQKTDVMLVVIGKSWLTTTDPGQTIRRLDDPNDVVRIEIETAIQLGVIIIPILVQDATMPTAAELPVSLHPLAAQQPVTVRRNPFFGADVEHMQSEIIARLQHRQPTTLPEALRQHWNTPRSRWAIAGLVAAPISLMLVDWPITLFGAYAGASQVGPIDAATVIGLLNILTGLICIVMGICVAVLLPRFPTTMPHGRAIQIIDILLVLIVGVPLLARLFQMIPQGSDFFDYLFHQPFDFSLTLPILQLSSASDSMNAIAYGNLALQWVIFSIVATALVIMVVFIRQWRMIVTLLTGLAASILLSAPSWLQYLVFYQDSSYTSVVPVAMRNSDIFLPLRSLSWQHLTDLITVYPTWQDRLQLSVVYGSAVVLLIVGVMMVIRSLLWRHWWWTAGLSLAGFAQLVLWKAFALLSFDARDAAMQSPGTVTLYSLLLIAALVVWPITVVFSTLYVAAPSQIEKVPS